jgi:2-keto-4-pentenoate hydratase/2-oxohepta-3-ene-1,7-dioic acid hydratase in catechol pathway
MSRPSKIVCIGLNFRDRPGKQNEDSERARLFFKATTSLVGPNDDLIVSEKWIGRFI